jgi:hypothetical protein
MKLKGHSYFSLFLIAVAGYAILSASGWSFKAGFFPLATAIPLLMLALTQLLFEFFGGPERAEERAVDAEFAKDMPPEVVRRRVIAIFSWIAAFILFVYLLGFPIAVPLFVFLFLTWQSKVSWQRSFLLSAITWACFYAVFERLVNLRFESGWIQSALGL